MTLDIPQPVREHSNNRAKLRWALRNFLNKKVLGEAFLIDGHALRTLRNRSRTMMIG